MSDKKIEVIVVEPGLAPRLATIEDSLEALQHAVGGLIEEYMPFEDEIALICNDEGKINGMPLNRGILDEDGRLMDIIAGPFLIAYAPIESENLLSLPEELKDKYMTRFKVPERFVKSESGIMVLPVMTAQDDRQR